jgi:hypothetical protein
MSGDWMAIIGKAKSTSGYAITVCVTFLKSSPRETSEITPVVFFLTDGRFLLTAVYGNISIIESFSMSLGSLSLTSSQRTSVYFACSGRYVVLF